MTLGKTDDSTESRAAASQEAIDPPVRLRQPQSGNGRIAANRAYYFLLKGSIAMANKQTEAGEAWLRKAQMLKLPSDNEKAMIELQFASVHLNKSHWKQAETHLRNIKQLKVTEPMLKEQIVQLEKVLQQQGQIKAANRMGMTRGGQMPLKPGGKRRRPPIR